MPQPIIRKRDGLRFMTTRVFSISSEEPNAGLLSEAADILRKGGLVGIPTETVYGLAANALDSEACLKIYKAKGRPADNPLIVHVDSLNMARSLTTCFPAQAEALAEAFWPGPLTMILPKAPCVPDTVTCSMPTVALRFPSHPVARALISACGFPLAAPSANRSGTPSPTTAAHVLHDFEGMIDGIIACGQSAVGVESTVITLCTPHPLLLRPGFVTLEELRQVAPEVQVDPAVFVGVKESEQVSSPGLKYKHYAPKARVTILKGDSKAYIRFLAAHLEERPVALCFEEELPSLPVPGVAYGSKADPASQAKALFSALRRLDEMGALRVYAHSPREDGVGMAVYNRLLRAAAFDVREL